MTERHGIVERAETIDGEQFIIVNCEGKRTVERVADEGDARLLVGAMVVLSDSE